MRSFDQIWKTGCSDFTVTMLCTVASGGHVLSENRAHGTHDGVLRLPTGAVDPTGNSIRNSIGDLYVGVFEVADGKIPARHIYFDRMIVAERLGLVPEPSTAG